MRRSPLNRRPAAFQQTLFSSPSVETLANAIFSGATPFPDPDPELTELEQRGKAVFNRACATCHGGSLHPSGSTPEAAIVRPIVRYTNVLASCVRGAAGTARTRQLWVVGTLSPVKLSRR